MTKREDFQTPEEKAALRRAIASDEVLSEALRRMYNNAFPDIPRVPSADALFADRVMEMREEYLRQVHAYLRQPDEWLLDTLSSAENVRPEWLAGGTGYLAATLYAASDRQQRECEQALADMAASGEITQSRLAALLKCLSKMDYRAAHAAEGRLNVYPPMAEAERSRLSCLLAMATYVQLKSGELPDAEPELSLDGVCLWTSAAMDIACAAAEEPPDQQETREKGAALLAAVLACQSMFVSAWPTLCACLFSLLTLVYPIRRTLEELMAGLNRQAETKELTDAAPVLSETLLKPLEALKSEAAREKTVAEQSTEEAAVTAEEAYSHGRTLL